MSVSSLYRPSRVSTSVVELPAPVVVSGVMTAVTFAAIGIAKSRAVEGSWRRDALETLALGGAAAALAFAVGYLLRGFVDAV